MLDRDHLDTPPQAPASPSRRRIFQAAAAVGLGAGLPQAAVAATRHAPKPASSLDAKLKAHVKNVVVIYLENRSFNNLFAHFPGLAAPLPSSAPQKDRDGSTLPVLPKIWGGMVPGRQDVGGKEYLIGEDKIVNLPNAPFALKDLDGKPLPEALVTRDLVH